MPASNPADETIVEETEREKLQRKQAPSRIVKPAPAVEDGAE